MNQTLETKKPIQPGVYITIDVECSMGGAFDDPTLNPVAPDRAVWGKYNGQELGIPRIIEILNEYHLPATFFVEAFIDEQGYPGQTRPICDYILEKGHDVQLHIHPCHQFYVKHRRGESYPLTDQMADLTAERQRELLEEGCRRIQAWTGKPPVAFRAGNMGASEETLRQLSAVGIHIDSSYCFPFVGRQCCFADRDYYNGSRWYGDVLEMAFSGFYQPRLPGLQKTKVLDPMGISFAECRSGILQICRAGADAVLILHSFSLFKVRNKQYENGRTNWIISRRLRKLCRWLAEEKKSFPVYTFSNLAQALRQGAFQAKAVAPGTLSPSRAILRKIVQGYNSFYRT